MARLLSGELDAPLIWPDVSRLVIDCNRAADVASLIVTESEGRQVPSNHGLSDEERTRRLDTIHGAYHAAIEACLAQRRASHLQTMLIAIHSYTPVFLGQARPWQVGMIFDDDRRLADHLVSGLKADPALTVGINEPYSPADNVYYTVARHSRPRDLPAAMIEIRNDEIGDDAGQRRWADRLGNILVAAGQRLMEAKHAAA